MAGVLSGMVVGVATVAFLMLSKRGPFIGLNAGFIALRLNFAVTGAISLLRPIEVSGFEEPLPRSVAQ